MSVKVTSLIWERAPYSGGSFLVLLALADCANDDGHCWPSIAYIARKARLQRRGIQKIIRKLEKDGFIDIEEGRGRGHQHRYKINLGNLQRLPSSMKGEIEDIKKADSATQKVHPGASFPVTQKANSATPQANSVTQKANSATQKVHPRTPDPLDPLVDPSMDPLTAFLDSLRTNPAYLHIDVDLEYQRAQTWASVNRRLVTKRFVVNWLNRIERPLNARDFRKAEAPKPIAKPQTEADYIANFECGLKLAPNYDISKDIQLIPDSKIRAGVSAWWSGRKGNLSNRRSETAK